MANSVLKFKAPTVAEVTDRRESNRLGFYRGEFPVAKIKHAGREYAADVYDLSAQGVGVLPCEQIPGLDTVGQYVELILGDSQPQKAMLQHFGHIKFSGAYRLKLGLRIVETGDEGENDAGRFYCGDCMPMAYCDDSFAFNRRILFNISFFSNMGLGLRTRNQDAAFYPGLNIDLRVMMPARGEFELKVQVKKVVSENDNIELVCEFVTVSQEFQNSISEFLLMNTDGITIAELRNRGFLVADIEKAFLFKCARTEGDFIRILELRLKAAQKDGRWLGETDVMKMKDKWDQHARQVYCELNGRIVAAGRVVFNNGLQDRSEHVSYDVEIPDWLWEAGFVEGSRVCTDPDFRGTDIFLQMMQHMCRIVTQSGYQYLVLNCVDSLVPVYKKTIGVTSLGKRFHTEFMQDRALNLLCVDMRAMQVAVNFMPSTWVVNAELGTHLISKGQLQLHWWERTARLVFRLAHILTLRRYRQGKYQKAASKRPLRLI